MAEIKQNTLTSLDKWPVTTDRFVGFIDIMGFKNMVLKMNHNSIYKMMQLIDQAKTENEALLDEDKGMVKITSYSDSIMVYSKDKTYHSYEAIIGTIAGLTQDLFEQGIPHKGAIAFGKMTLDTDRSIFFGQPLIDAYLLQEELHYYGIILHHTVEAKLLNKSSAAFVVKYECPLKLGKSNHLTVFPIYADKNSSTNYPKQHLSLHNSLEKMKEKTSGHLRRYIDNTRTYFDFVKTFN